MKPFYYSLFLICIGCLSASSQNRMLTGADAKKMIKESDRIIINSKRNTSSFIHLAADQFVSAQDNVLWLRTALNLRSGDGLELYKTDIDNIGYTHYRYHQTYMGVPVQYGVYYVHTLKGRIVSANGEWYGNIVLPTQPKITPKQAYDAAVSYVHANTYQHELEDNDNNELVVLPYEGGYYLAYRCDVFALQPLSREWYFIDANTGSLIKADNRICSDIAHGTASTQYSGTRTIVTDSISPTSFRLRDVTRGNGVFTYAGPSGTSDYYDTDDIWNTDKPPLDCHFGAEATYDYYWNHFGQNGLDGSGFNLVCYAHDGLYVNAFWDGASAHFGDGDGGAYGPLTDALIVGHEFTHGVTQLHSGLIYSCESGGLNEGFSDIFGQAVDWENNPGTASWYVSGNNTGTPFRSMANPKEFSCPDTYGGEFWNTCGEVHSISGVLNHWYYLLVGGGSAVNDLGDAYTVLGIGFDDATAVAYRVNAYYLTPNATYEDAKDYGIQSAIDLFGNCSDQVIQTTNAWYAVGLGGIFSDAVVSSFSVPSNYFCVVPASVSFTNNSLNGTSYLWDFGDGTTSTLTNPGHNYDSAGIYTVTLIANGSAACGNHDTLTMANFISVTNSGGPVSASCIPSTIANCCGVGITHVQFGDIDKTSGNGSEGYKDFTCSNSATFTAGDPVSIHITTGATTYENVRVFIDYDNNGVLNSMNESVFTSANQSLNHTGIVYTPITAVLNTPLRMRVIDDAASYSISSSCYNSQQGQAEDYTIIFIENTLPPVADFTANFTTVNVGSAISFSDLTIHSPTSWTWSFPGGTPSSSLLQNSTVTYNSTGTYDVQLIASNSFGADTILKTAYISVVSSVNMCATTSSIAPSGILYDSGGPTGNYQDYETCTLLLSPPCADTIVFSLSALNTESCCDHLSVYDGIDNSGPLILYVSGYTLPAPVKATSGNMFISWYSDYSVTGNGYAATWNTIEYSTIPPVANFAISDTTPPLNVSVQFTDASLNSPNAWIWDFGDGFASAQQNPSHAFAAAGTYSVTLIASTCTSSDTITKSLVVQSAPVMSSSPDSMNVILSCGDVASFPIIFSNSGSGDLVAQLQALSFNQPLEVLALTYGTDLSTEYPNTINAINTYFTNYNLTTINTTSGSDLAAALVGKSVFLMTEPETGSSSVYTGFATALQDFVSNGGIAILCGAYGTQSACTFNTGLLSGSFYADATSQTLTTSNPLHPIMQGVTGSVMGTDGTYVYDITDGDKNQLLTYFGKDVVTTRQIGSGNVVFIAFDYYSSNDNAKRIVSNAVKWGEEVGQGQLPDWINVNPDSVLVNPGGSDTVWVTFNSVGVNAGTYSYYLVWATNDPLHPFDSIYLTMSVSGPAVLQLSEACLNYPTIMQYTTSDDSVLVKNNGCDTLHCTGMSCSIAEFTILSGTNLDILPHDSAYIKVQFNPSTAGTFSGSLIIPNNAADTLVCLTGASFLAPNIEIVPAAIDVTITTCSDSITVPVQVINSGGSLLNYYINGGSGNAGPLKVLALTYGTDLSTEYPNTINAINQYFTDYTLTTINTTSASELQSALINQDVFLMTEPETGVLSVYSGFSVVLQDFVNAGGYAVLCGAGGTQSACITNTGLFSGSYVQDAGGLTVNVVDGSHPVTQGVASTFSATDGTYVLNIDNMDNHPLVEYGGYDVVSYRNMGNGTAVFIAFDYFSYNTNTEKLMANSFSWLRGLKGANWMSVSIDSGTVNTSDTTTFYVTISRKNLLNGTYTTNLIVGSNDPLHPFDTIPVTLTVESPPCANFSNADADCYGTVCFTDSTNSATSWSWNFGDGVTSTLQNPCHTYSTTGAFTATLVTCNDYGCDSITKTVSVIYLGGVVAASCSPGTDFYCCGIGITNVSFNTINQSSGDASQGYEDFSCYDQTIVNSGAQYTMNVTTGFLYYENVRAWIDWDNNGIFATSELVFTSDNHLTDHSGIIDIPATATLNLPLRMRVGSDYYSSPAPSPCVNAGYGQFEDYAIIVTDNEPPNAAYNFSADICSGIVSFFDYSTHTPTSWNWNFGDGQTSTLQNPAHTYTLAGTYTCTLIACNIIGCDTFIQPVTVSMLNADFNYSGSLVTGSEISFTGIANGATLWQWTFGDGGFSNVQSPAYTYTTPGIYIVTLVVSNSAGCFATMTDTLVIIPTSLDEASGTTGLTVFPNPFYSETFILLNLASGQTVTLRAFDVTGRIVKTFLKDERMTAGVHRFDFMPAEAGIYFIEFKCASNDVVRKVLKVK